MGQGRAAHSTIDWCFRRRLRRADTPAPLKKGPLKRVVRLRDQTPEKANDSGQEQPRRSAIVTPKGKRISLFGDAPDMTPEEHRRRGDAADALFREIVRRARLPESDD